ncbi:HlyD family efflux transporter periplasmic adaptor subunit [Roseobacter sinensis]|uniref:HlyD family efflux transporter periplasmic adaptor subunit n=1 Tax=Roseobacter sinensis TaxID=2931391 RepID=A0ABT3BLI7_9RHOB|nr:HlyD family efflux transporter periplasmic adaptor subunit [Roseobacter sp. WL0113]MCV3274224.1 HlyD family efflux transporter periplasmic adaptor subunit [Roseobacter sp. WL0113]
MSDPARKDLPLKDTGIERAVEKEDPAGPTKLRGRTGRLARVFLTVPGFVLAVLLGGVIGLYYQPPGLQAVFEVTGLQPGGGTDTPIALAIQQVQTHEEVAVISGGDVVALGRVIPKGDVVTVAPPFGAGDARVEELRVREGATVAAGDVLAVLDNREQLESAVETARAALLVRQAALLQAQADVDASLREARAALERAEATSQAADAELERTTSLLERGVTTRAVFDAALARATEAQRDVASREATLSRFDVAGDTPLPTVLLAKAEVAAAEADLASAELSLDESFVRAPIDGTVIAVNIRPGEKPGNDGIMELGNTAEMNVEAEVYQSMIGRVAIGDPVEITADAFSMPLNGTVSAIGLAIGRQTITSDDPAANTDARVVDVIVSLDADSSQRAARLTNLEVITRIDAGRDP